MFPPDEDKARELSGSDLDLPDDVLAAQDELRALTLEEENTLRRKEQVLKQLEESKAKAARIEEVRARSYRGQGCTKGQ